MNAASVISQSHSESAEDLHPPRTQLADLPSDELARRASEGCAEAFAQLVHEYTPRLFRYLFQMTRNAHDAEDLTQDTFVKAFRRLPKFNAPAAFTAWIYTIARRTALNHFRSARPVEELTETSHPTTDPDPSNRAEARDDWNHLWKIASRLKPEYHEALWLRFAEGLSVEEVARTMGLGQIHVRVLIHRGRQQLLKRLKHPGQPLTFNSTS